MLRASEGASLAQLCAALGWQAHTLRAALTRLRQAGHSVERSRTKSGQTVHRIMPGGSGDTMDMPSEAEVTVELTFSGERAASAFAALQNGEDA